jgi:MFS family permease
MSVRSAAARLIVHGSRLIVSRSLLGDRRLATLLAGVLLTYLGLGIIIPVRALYAREVGLSLAGIGAMASSFLLFNTLGQVPFGWLTDQLGRKPLIAAGIAVEVVIAVLYVALSEPWTFIALRAAEGMAAAAITPAARAYVADVAPPARRGEAFGLLGAAFSGGILLGPALGGGLSALAGYQTAFLVSAAGRLAALTLVLALVREPLAHAAPATEPAPARAGWRAAVSPLLAGCYLAAIGVGFTNGLYFALWSLWLADIGAALWQIGLTYTAFALPSLLLTPLAGRLGDRLGRLPLLVGPGLADAAIYLVYGLTTNVGLVLALCLVQGVLYACVLPSLDGLVADASPAAGRGRVQGVFAGIGQAAAFLSAMGCTVLYGWHPSAPFLTLTAVTGATLAAGAAVLWRAQRRAPART